MAQHVYNKIVSLGYGSNPEITAPEGFEFKQAVSLGRVPDNEPNSGNHIVLYVFTEIPVRKSRKESGEETQPE